MKTIAKLSVVAAGLVAALPFVTSLSFAEEAASAASATPAPATATPHSHAKAAHVMKHRRAIAHLLARQLNLNDSQKEQLKAIRGSARTTIAGIRANTGLTPEQKKAQIREALVATRGQMRGVLSPEQQAKLEELKDRAWQRRGGF